MGLQLDLVKNQKQTLQLGLSKNNEYLVKLFWDSRHDLDVHAVGITKNGNKRTINADVNRVLSTYNTACVLTNNTAQNIRSGEDQPFEVPQGYMKHTGDVRSATASNVDPEEELVVVLNKVPDDVNQIGFVVTIDPPNLPDAPNTANFSQVKNAKMQITEANGTVLLEAKLTEDFATSNVVYLGAIEKEGLIWNFDASPEGIDGTLNDFLGGL